MTTVAAMYDERGLHPYVAYLKDRYPHYGAWAAGQGIPEISGQYVEDCRAVPLSPWRRTGGTGVFINLSDQTVNDAFLSELPPGRSLHPDRHLYEEVVYVIAGTGATTLWQSGGAAARFEWSAGSLFAIPVNAWYQHHNADGARPARLLCVTNAPLMINIFHNVDFVTDCDFTFTDRDTDIGTGTPAPGSWGGRWAANFVPDLRRLVTGEEAVGDDGDFTLPETTMEFRVRRLPPGGQAEPRPSRPGGHLYILDGEGYMLTRTPAGGTRRFDWHAGTLLSPPAGWHHQQFNTGSGLAAYLELQQPAFAFDKNSGDAVQLAYEAEDPRVRADYAREIAASGLTILMPPVGRDD